MIDIKEILHHKKIYVISYSEVLIRIRCLYALQQSKLFADLSCFYAVWTVFPHIYKTCKIPVSPLPFDNFVAIHF